MSQNNVAGQQGELQLSIDSGVILSSSGDLQNDEKTASILYKIVKSTWSLEKVKTLSISFQSNCYVIVLSGNKIHIVKKESHSDI